MVEEANNARDWRLELRVACSCPQRLSASQLKQLDSSLKKVTPFLKKVGLLVQVTSYYMT